LGGEIFAWKSTRAGRGAQNKSGRHDCLIGMPALFCAITSACSSKWIFAEAKYVALAIDQSIFNMMSRGPIKD
jgi:hypothetical protein